MAQFDNMERDFSIDILKFLAVFLIINSHMDALYVHYRFLATGGAIGDAIFLFCSGYTLLLSKKNLRFDNWYKRRIARIFTQTFGSGDYNWKDVIKPY